MDNRMSSVVIKNVFTIDEINALRQDQHSRPVTHSEAGILNKNLDYLLPTSVVNQIVKPKLDMIIGSDHEFSTGCYKDAVQPYATHVDNWENQKKHFYFADQSRYGRAVLIPLSEDPEFRTIIFKVYNNDITGMGQVLPESLLDSSNDLNMEWFTHLSEPLRKQINSLPLDTVFQWKVGDLVHWHRSALHASTDFAKFGLRKRFIIIFIA